MSRELMANRGPGLGGREVRKRRRIAMASYHCILTDDPRPSVRRLTLNRPEKRNALNNQLRAEILQALEEADRDPDVRVSILRGAGVCFSAGYDLGSNNAEGQP